MKTKFFFRSFLLVFAFFRAAAFAPAQTTGEPFKAGESLGYEVKYSKAVLRGIEVAELSFTIEKLPDSQNYAVKSLAKPKGTLSGMVIGNFLQKYESIVDGDKLQILKTVKRDEQGSRVRASEAIFDYRTKKVVFTETDPNDAARPPRRAASAVEIGTQDLISAIYMMRRLPLAVGKTFELNISDSGLVYKIPIRVTARERQKSVLGKVWCFRVEPEVFGKNRLVEREGTMSIWITDDARRLPVRSQINLNIGRIEVKLKSNGKR